LEKEITEEMGNTNGNPIASAFTEGNNEMPVRKWKSKYEVAIPDGRYANGRVKYKRELADTEEEAFSREQELLRELKRFNSNLLNRGEAEKPKILFRDVATKWLKRKKFEVAYKTWERYDTIVKYHILPIFGKRHILDIDEDEIMEYFLGNKNCGTTLQQHHTILKGIFKLAKSDVMKDIKRPRKNNTEINCIKDPFELARFVSSIKNSVLFLPVYIAATTGMRLSEIAGLRWKDVNLETGYITVNRSLHWKKEGEKREWYVKETKNGSSRRTIKISAKDVNLLQEHKEKNMVTGEDFVCVNAEGNPLAKDSISSNFKARALARGYNISFHSLRHSHATILIQYYKKSINAVSKRLGHASIVTTLAIYASVIPREDEDIAETMGEIMENI